MRKRIRIKGSEKRINIISVLRGKRLLPVTGTTTAGNNDSLMMIMMAMKKHGLLSQFSPCFPSCFWIFFPFSRRKPGLSLAAGTTSSPL